MRKVLTVCVAGLLLAFTRADAQQIFFRISLDSTLTNSNSPAKGSGYAYISSDLKTLTYQLTVNKLQGSLQSAHFHAHPTGAILKDISTSFTGNTASGTWTNVPDSVLKYLFSDSLRVYINVHTSTAPNGEIRGFLYARQGAFSVSIDSTKTNSGSGGRGSGWVMFEDSSGVRALRYRFTYAGLKGTINASNGAHFHSANNGAVMNPITFVDSTADGYWTNYPDSVISLFLRGKVYVNIHTSFASGGEVRGTPTLVGEHVFVASLDGSQATTASAAKGTAWAALTQDLSKIRYSVTYNRLEGTFNGAHFHNAAGAVIRTINISGNTANEDWTGFSDTDLQALVKGTAYVNVHSLPNYSNGEIRGVLKLKDGVFTAKLDGSQAGTASNGKGTAWLDISGDTAKYSMTVTGMSGSISASHFHIAPSGAILQPISVSDSNAIGNWVFPDSLVASLVKGKLYINVHNPGGGVEIRGNLGPGSAVITEVQQLSNTFPESFSLGQNYPNPFNPTTTIDFEVKKSGLVSLRIFNLLGQEVATLVNEIRPAGTYRVSFNAGSLTTGVYFYRLTADNFTQTKRMLLIR